uniref:Pre-16S rRNA nuclease n=1 Tax=Tanacetum cinerariifolium TaxID=118510 RepID=A0A6L2JIN0_TANCI|nr:pre-16S rRNA nuclease [Tanacetum cinerariifolium]
MSSTVMNDLNVMDEVEEDIGVEDSNGYEVKGTEGSTLESREEMVYEEQVVMNSTGKKKLDTENGRMGILIVIKVMMSRWEITMGVHRNRFYFDPVAAKKLSDKKIVAGGMLQDYLDARIKLEFAPANPMNTPPEAY